MKWLDRSAFRLPIYVGLATSKAALDKEMRKIKGPLDLGMNQGAGATTNFVTSTQGDCLAIVCMFDHKGLDIEQVYALLAHEAVHIFQEVATRMGEKNPSDEFQAWTIQKISQDLFYEYKRQTQKKIKVKK